MESGIDSVMKVAAFNSHLPHWKIYYGYDAKGGALAATSESIQPIGNLDVDLSHRKLKEALKLLPTGDYLVQFKLVPNANGAIISHRFDITATEGAANNPGIGTAPTGYVPQALVAQMISQATEKVLAEVQLKNVLATVEEMKKELKESRKNSNSELLKDAIGAAKMFFSMANNTAPALGPTVGISGVEAPPVPEIEEDAKEAQAKEVHEKATYGAMWTNTLTEFGNREGGQKNVITLFACLNEWIKENPVMYENLKPTILQHKEKLYEVYRIDTDN